MNRRILLYSGGGLLLLGGVAGWLMRKKKSPFVAPSGSPAFTLPSFATKEPATHTSVDSDGFVRASPQALAVQANVDVTTNTLGRFLRSEFGSGTPLERAAIAWAIINKAKARGWPMLRMATTVCWKEDGQPRCFDTGYYGRQNMGGATVDGAIRSSANRYAATTQDPTRADLYIATMVLAGAWPDPTRGAQMFLDPSAFGKQAGTSSESLQRVVADWLQRNEEVVVSGIRADKLRLFRPRA